MRSLFAVALLSALAFAQDLDDATAVPMLISEAPTVGTSEEAASDPAVGSSEPVSQPASQEGAAANDDAGDAAEEVAAANEGEEADEVAAADEGEEAAADEDEEADEEADEVAAADEGEEATHDDEHDHEGEMAEHGDEHDHEGEMAEHGDEHDHEGEHHHEEEMAGHGDEHEHEGEHHHEGEMGTYMDPGYPANVAELSAMDSGLIYSQVMNLTKTGFTLEDSDDGWVRNKITAYSHVKNETGFEKAIGITSTTDIDFVRGGVWYVLLDDLSRLFTGHSEPYLFAKIKIEEEGGEMVASNDLRMSNCTLDALSDEDAYCSQSQGDSWDFRGGEWSYYSAPWDQENFVLSSGWFFCNSSSGYSEQNEEFTTVFRQQYNSTGNVTADTYFKTLDHAFNFKVETDNTAPEDYPSDIESEILVASVKWNDLASYETDGDDPEVVDENEKEVVDENEEEVGGVTETATSKKDDGSIALTSTVTALGLGLLSTFF